MKRLIFPLFGLCALLLVACNTPIAAREITEIEATPGPLPQDPPASCPITQPPDPAFTPPEPYPAVAPYGEFWYGTNELWTMVQPDGRWVALPHDESGYGQKIFLWREGYDMTTENQPQIAMSGRRLDGAETFTGPTGGTNGYHGDMGQFMLTGVSIPTVGCWEITGQYRDATLSFVVWVAP